MATPDNQITADQGVGYCKPPIEHRFKPGQSGNPKGRPKSVGTSIVEHMNLLDAAGASVTVLRRIAKDPDEAPSRATAALRLLRMREDADLADYQELMDGKLTIKQLRDVGINTSAIKKYKQKSRVVPLGDGDKEEIIEREIQLHDRSGEDFDRVMDRTIGKALAAQPEEQASDLQMFDTSGQLESMLPAGAVPEMPADVMDKPDLSHVVDNAAKVKPPDPRERERPGNMRPL